jgi:hypothetical protein
MTLEENLRHTVQSRDFLGEMYERGVDFGRAGPIPPASPLGHIAAWLAHFYDLILGRAPHRTVERSRFEQVTTPDEAKTKGTLGL